MCWSRLDGNRSGLSANDDSGYNCSANDRSAFYRYKTASIDYSRICNRKRISEKSRRLEIQYCRTRFLWPSKVNVDICSSEKSILSRLRTSHNIRDIGPVNLKKVTDVYRSSCTTEVFSTCGNTREVQTAIKRWFRSQAADFYDTKIRKLIT
ncbi:hypothetical protein ANN_12076 [Periplaneta americana]|uniref:Uncharacterized protein n=1 Tax=Periplaneta americana TaxID=6978 RepID=A0ABQ8T6U2_PERAM|nr:hypothetical protein ANN_12076 [Periplaneta americana]